MRKTISNRAIAGLCILSSVAACSSDGGSQTGGGLPPSGFEGEVANLINDLGTSAIFSPNPIAEADFPTGPVQYVGPAYISLTFLLEGGGEDTSEGLFGTMETTVDFQTDETSLTISDLGVYEIPDPSRDSSDPFVEETGSLTSNSITFVSAVEGSFSGTGTGLMGTDLFDFDGPPALVIEGEVSGQMMSGSSFEMAGEIETFGILIETGEGTGPSLLVRGNRPVLTASVDGVPLDFVDGFMVGIGIAQ